MNSSDIQGGLLRSKIEEMRRLFDESFAAQPAERMAAREAMLALTVAGERMAVRLSDVHTLATLKGRLLPIPSRVPELMGVTGIRGSLVPVFSLAALMGLGNTEASPGGEALGAYTETHAGIPRWLLLCGSRVAPIALAFQRFDEHIQVERDEVFPPGEATEAQRYINGSVRWRGVMRSIINLPKLVERLMASTPASRQD